MLTRQDLGSETYRRISQALSRWNDSQEAATPEASFTLDHDSAAALRHLIESHGRSGTTRSVRFDGRPAFVYLGFERGGEPFVHGLGESPELAIAEAFLNTTPDPEAPDS